MFTLLNSDLLQGEDIARLESVPLVGAFHVLDHSIKLVGGLLIVFSIQRTLFVQALLAAESKRLLWLALLVVIAESLQPLIVYSCVARITRENLTQDRAYALLGSALLSALPVTLLTMDELLGVCHGRCREVGPPKGFVDTLRHPGHYALLCHVCRYGPWRLLTWRQILL